MQMKLNVPKLMKAGMVGITLFASLSGLHFLITFFNPLM